MTTKHYLALLTSVVIFGIILGWAITSHFKNIVDTCKGDNIDSRLQTISRSIK